MYSADFFSNPAIKLKSKLFFFHRFEPAQHERKIKCVFAREVSYFSSKLTNEKKLLKKTL